MGARFSSGTRSRAPTAAPSSTRSSNASSSGRGVTGSSCPSCRSSCRTGTAFVHAEPAATVDGVVRTIANTLLANLRLTDFLFRWEDDEFLALLVEADLEACKLKVARLGETFKPWREGKGPDAPAAQGARRRRHSDRGPRLRGRPPDRPRRRARYVRRVLRDQGLSVGRSQIDAQLPGEPVQEPHRAGPRRSRGCPPRAPRRGRRSPAGRRRPPCRRARPVAAYASISAGLIGAKTTRVVSRPETIRPPRAQATPVTTSCARPASATSMRRASARSFGFPSAAPVEDDERVGRDDEGLGRRRGRRPAFARASRSAASKALSPGRSDSSTSAARTSNVRPRAVRISRRRGDDEARTTPGRDTGGA